MNTANPEQRDQNQGPVTMNQFIQGQQQQNQNQTSQALTPAESQKLSDAEKEEIISQTIAFIIPTHGLIAGIRYIADNLVETPTASIALNERFAVLNYGASANPFVVDVLKLVIASNQEAQEAFELYDVWERLTIYVNEKEKALQRFHSQIQQQQTMFLGANIGMMSRKPWDDAVLK